MALLTFLTVVHVAKLKTGHRELRDEVDHDAAINSIFIPPRNCFLFPSLSISAVPLNAAKPEPYNANPASHHFVAILHTVIYSIVLHHIVV